MSIILSLAGGPSAVPTVTDNFDGTRTATWTFDTGENLTLSNVSIQSGAATLTTFDNSWTQTTKQDFANGNGTNVAYLDEGSLTLGRIEAEPSPERIAVSRGNGDVHALAVNGTLEWIGNISGQVSSIDSMDPNKDGYREGVAAISDTAANAVRAFNSTGSVLWNNVDPPPPLKAICAIDLDEDGFLDEVVAGGDSGVLYAIDANGTTNWANDTTGQITSITVADLDGNGLFSDTVIGTTLAANRAEVRAFNRTGDELWRYEVPFLVVEVVNIANHTTGLMDRIAAVDTGGYIFVFNRAGGVEWSDSMPGEGTAMAAADLESVNVMDGLSVGDTKGNVWNFNATGFRIGSNTLAKSVRDLISVDANSDGRSEFVYVGDAEGNTAMFYASGTPLWSIPTANVLIAVNAVSASDLDGDGYVDDVVAGLSNGSVMATSSDGVIQWFHDTGGAVLDLTRLQNGNRYFASATWISTVFDANSKVLWTTLSWTSSLPSGANLSLSSRSGDSPTPDGSWSAWSPMIWTAGSSIMSPPARYLQVNVNLTTVNQFVRPKLLNFTVSYSSRAPIGYIETADFGPPDLLKWGVFNSSSVIAPNTSIAYAYSGDGGLTWTVLSVGANLSTILSNRLRFRVILETTDAIVSSTLLEMSITYEYLGPIDHIHVSPPSWSGTPDSTASFSAVAHDFYNRSVSTVLKWETSDPLGTVDSSGLYHPGLAGVWRVYANTTDNSAGGYATVSISPGSRVRIGIIPWNPGTVVAGTNITFDALAYDQRGNQIGPVVATWIVSGGIGQLSPTSPTPSSVLSATTVGVGTVFADDNTGHTNTTASITVIAAALNRIDVTPNPVNILVNASVAFTAKGFDRFDNQVALSGSSWSTNAGMFVSTTNTSAILTTQATPVAGAYVCVTVGAVQGCATVNVVEIDKWPKINGIVPDQVKPEDFGSWVLDLSSYASDPRYPSSALHWEMMGRNESLFTIHGLGIEGNHLLSFSTILHAYGVNQVTLLLVNPDDFSDSQDLWINITFINYRPAIDSISPFTIHYDIPYNYYFHDYVRDIETPKERLVLTSSDPAHISINGLWATFTYPESMKSPPPVYPVITVTDAHGASDSTVLVITVSSDYVPTITRPLPDVVLFEGQEIKNYFDLDDYFSDPDGNALFYTFGNTHVDIRINANHTVDFSAPGLWSGNETVTFRAIDPQGARAEDQILVTVIPVNNPPTISGVPNLYVRYDDPAYPDYNYTFDLSPYISDVDNPSQELAVTTTEPAYIRFFLPLNMLMSIHFPVSMNGTVLNVTISVSDGEASASQSILITVTDDWPPELLNPIPDQAFWEDTSLRGAFNVSIFFSDKDGDSLYFTYGNHSVLVYIDPTTRVVDLSAKPDWFGAERVTFRATDPTGAIAEYTITVTVLPVDDAPIIAPIPDINVVVGDTYVLDLSLYVSDVDNSFHELSFIVNCSVPGAARIIGEYLILAYDETGSYSVRLLVSDGNLTAWRDVAVVVAPKPGSPVLGLLTLPFVLLFVLLLIIFSAIVVKRTLLKMVIEEVFVIHTDGRLLAVESRPGQTRVVDDDIFSGMLTLIQSFARESFKKMEDAPLKRVEFGKQKILIERSDAFCVAVVYSGFEKASTVKTINGIVKGVDAEFGEILADWDGLIGPVSGISAHLKALWE